MKPSISRKMDMVKDVFLDNKRLQEHLLSVEDWVLDNHSDIFIDEFIPFKSTALILIFSKPILCKLSIPFKISGNLS